MRKTGHLFRGEFSSEPLPRKEKDAAGCNIPQIVGFLCNPLLSSTALGARCWCVGGKRSRSFQGPSSKPLEPRVKCGLGTGQQAYAGLLCQGSGIKQLDRKKPWTNSSWFTNHYLQGIHAWKTCEVKWVHKVSLRASLTCQKWHQLEDLSFVVFLF